MEYNYYNNPDSRLKYLKKLHHTFFSCIVAVFVAEYFNVILSSLEFEL